MRRLLLTSAGFENPMFAELFIKESGISPDKIKVLFIPTAAIDEGGKAMLPKCRADLTGCGVPDENITVYDLDRQLSEAEISDYSAIYVCGGSPEYLLSRMNAVDFGEMLKTAFKHRLIYIGVSAGSIVCCNNLSENLGFYSKKIGVHCDTASIGEDYVNLTDNQAIWICGENITVLPVE